MTRNRFSKKLNATSATTSWQIDMYVSSHFFKSKHQNSDFVNLCVGPFEIFCNNIRVWKYKRPKSSREAFNPLDFIQAQCTILPNILAKSSWWVYADLCQRRWPPLFSYLTCSLDKKREDKKALKSSNGFIAQQRRYLCHIALTKLCITVFPMPSNWTMSITGG